MQSLLWPEVSSLFTSNFGVAAQSSPCWTVKPYFEVFRKGYDHGIGHPLLFPCNVKAHNCLNNNGLNDLGHYSKWPKVADAVIEAFENNRLCFRPANPFLDTILPISLSGLSRAIWKEISQLLIIKSVRKHVRRCWELSHVFRRNPKQIPPDLVVKT